MPLQTAIHLADILVWLCMAGSIAYVLLFALASLLPERRRKVSDTKPSNINQRSFLVLFPAYGEDSVILQSIKTFLKQEYPADKYHVVVISDHMRQETNEALSALPITLLTPYFDKSSKARAMQYAMANTHTATDHVIVLDADNIVGTDFLYRLNLSCNQGYKAIQCHRCAKNADNDISMLDGASEEINNTIFRKGHNRIGLPSALIGSGMCFDRKWFETNVTSLSTAGEDRELEMLLLCQKIYVRYEEDIHVLDEKVSNADNFKRQRIRWMSAQFNSLLTMLPHIPHAIASGNVWFIDKTIQQMLIPRSILILLTTSIAIIMSAAAPLWSIKWWLLAAALCLALLIATPRLLLTRSLLARLTSLPHLAIHMLCGIRKIDKHNQDFTHTTHDK